MHVIKFCLESHASKDCSSVCWRRLQVSMPTKLFRYYWERIITLWNGGGNVSAIVRILCNEVRATIRATIRCVMYTILLLIICSDPCCVVSFLFAGLFLWKPLSVLGLMFLDFGHLVWYALIIYVKASSSVAFIAAILKAARTRSGPVATRFTSSSIKEHKKVKELERKMSIEDQKLRKKFDEVCCAVSDLSLVCSIPDESLIFCRRSSLSPKSTISRSVEHRQIEGPKLRRRSSWRWAK